MASAEKDDAISTVDEKSTTSDQVNNEDVKETAKTPESPKDTASDLVRSRLMLLRTRSAFILPH